jgi:hypothetical protein
MSGIVLLKSWSYKYDIRVYCPLFQELTADTDDPACRIISVQQAEQDGQNEENSKKSN